MSELPLGWAMASIGEISEDCSQRVPHADESFQYIDIGSIDRDRKRIASPQALVGANAPSRARKEVRSGDVIVSMTRPNLNAVAMVPAELDAQIASTGFDVLRPLLIDPRWLYYLVRTKTFVDSMSGLVQGALYPAVRSKDVRGFAAPVAPLAEQKRVADRIDALLARVGTCRERLDRVPGIIKSFRQSILLAATSGELTREWREINPQFVDAAALARTIHEAHSQAGGHKVGNAAPPTEGVHDLSAEMFPEGWSLLTLRDLVRPDRPITYGILKPGPELDEGVPYIRVADFPGDRLNLASVRKTSPAIDAEFKRSRLLEGDILLSIRGTVGRVVVTPPQLEGANITQDTARLSIQSSVNATYVLWALRSELLQQRMRGAEKGVAVRGINIGDVRALQVPLPSRAEQDEIVTRVEALIACSDRLEEKVLAAIRCAEELTHSVLEQAFRGQLVPQDPSDEPASELLMRLRTLRSMRVESRGKRRSSIEKKPAMNRTDKDVIKAVILKLKKDRFSFDDLQASVSADYESIKDALFELLQEPNPVVRQVFDKKGRAMKIERVKL